jgi:putative SOS response-associated peptidase YedK
MCAEYQVTASNKKIQEALGIPLTDDELGKPNSNNRIKLSTPAPVVYLKNGLPILGQKIFPVNPFPNSRLSSLANGAEDEVPTDKDIKRIYDTPLWKKSFAENPVLIPMTSFFEPVYWGKDIGTVQEFKVPGEDVFFTAGMLIKPRIPKSDSLDGFSIFTHTATDQMLRYHQRLVVILKPEAAAAYLDEMSPQQRFDFLIENRYRDELEVSKDRTMAKGWDKKIAVQEAKLRREQAYIDTLKTEQVEG